MEIVNNCASCHFRCQFEIFFIQKTAIIFSRKTTGQPTHSFVHPFKHFNPPSLTKLEQKLHKNFENWVILGFFSFSVSILDIFLSEHCIYLFIKDNWTTILFLDVGFQHSNLRSLSKFRQKMHENFEN